MTVHTAHKLQMTDRKLLDQKWKQTDQPDLLLHMKANKNS
jgi:hypothetical protein